MVSGEHLEIHEQELGAGAFGIADICPEPQWSFGVVCGSWRGYLWVSAAISGVSDIGKVGVYLSQSEDIELVSRALVFVQVPFC